MDGLRNKAAEAETAADNRATGAWRFVARRMMIYLMNKCSILVPVVFVLLLEVLEVDEEHSSEQN